MVDQFLQIFQNHILTWYGQKTWEQQIIYIKPTRLILKLNDFLLARYAWENRKFLPRGFGLEIWLKEDLFVQTIVDV